MIQKINHIGIAVHNLSDATKFYRDTFGLDVQLRREIPDQGVTAVHLAIGDSAIELLEPLTPESPVGRYLERQGEGLHHICLQTNSIDRELDTIKSKKVALIDQEPRRGLLGRVSFLHPSSFGRVLVELAELDHEIRPAQTTTIFKRIDHVVIATKDIKKSTCQWKDNLGLAAEPSIQPAGASFCIAKIPIGSAFLELVQPKSDNSSRFTQRFKEQGEGIFSISVEVESLEAAIAYMQEKAIKISDPEPGIWPKSRVSRLSATSCHGVSIQLIQHQASI